MEVLATKKCEIAQGMADSKVWFRLGLEYGAASVDMDSKDSEK